MLPENKKQNIKMYKIISKENLINIEKEKRPVKTHDTYPWAVNTSYVEIAENIFRDKEGFWATPLYFIESSHKVIHGIDNICKKADEFLNQLKTKYEIDKLSLFARMDGNKINLLILLRPYTDEFTVSEFVPFFELLGDDLFEEVKQETVFYSGNLIIPDEIKNFKITEEEQKEHDFLYKEQLKILNSATREKPFLNSIEKYIPKKIRTPEDSIDLIYDLKTKDMRISTIAPYEHFISVFREIMQYVNGVEYYHYVNVINGDESEDVFMGFLEDYVENSYVIPGKLDKEDVPVLMEKLRRSLFQLYIIQDLIDDPKVTDIKITAPDSIRARVEGKAYSTNISFIDEQDYRRFVNMIAIRNRISLKIPEQTFTDNRDKNYAMRLSVTAEYVNSVDWPYLHIRKIDRQKYLLKDLVEHNMMDEKIMEYLIDCGKNSRGVVFAGPPGSGKTVCLNAYLEEAYEQSAEILIIQENDELFCYRKGVMIQHVVNYTDDGELPVNLEQLGQLALVAGANVFIIGEAKGAEICSAITLSNSGCRTAITIHSPSSVETIDKMADLAMRGYAQDIDQAKRMLKSFQTIVYLENFQIKEISEITGYNEETHEMEYRYIYRREE